MIPVINENFEMSERPADQVRANPRVVAFQGAVIGFILFLIGLAVGYYAAILETAAHFAEVNK